MPAKVESSPPLPGLSPVAGKPLVARFDGGQLSSDGGLLALREVERRLGIADRLAACIDDPRAPGRVRHGIAAILRFRMLMIAAGYEDGNDADSLRHDPVFKLALDQLPDGAALCSQPTISRLENLPDLRTLLRTAQAMVGLYCGNFRQVPRRIVLDVDDTFDAVHGEQQLRLFNAHYDEYGFQPIVVFDGEGRPVVAMLRPAHRPSGREARAFLRRLVREIRAHWPRVEILIRADSHYCAPEVLDFCRAEGLDFILGVASTTTLRRHVTALEQSAAARRAAMPGADKLRRYTEFYDGAGSWSRVERIIARIEASAQGTDTRFIVTNLSGGSARALYERSYCQRGQAENHLKAWKRHLAADRTSCSRATANQFRLMLHTGAYWLLWSLRSLMPKRSTWRTAQFDTLRLRLVKLATRVVALKTRVMLHLPSACPDHAIMRLALSRLPRLTC
ncbi:IS1380 family transposase [Siccirubricoccus sp. G192]|uniref:IS1380 family transposase n=1 Tax=Siccirubricoccus sp. G192 TaxID=2849651 RepID=UPI001C2C5F59|nr:IS1380 family transposase [Siccirubricoccus sp. G192]MBV1800084.1 IS1380 family transposase [Siccirubricoccus sp. G192]MBV1800134.1 IS1380 family transposase [Siccirubricoccus sp. G192]